MKNILIISGSISNVNRVRRFLGDEYRISATNSHENAETVLRTKPADLVIFHAGKDYSDIFAFYKDIRQNPETENLPLIFITDVSFIHAMSDKIEFRNAEAVGVDAGGEELLNLTRAFL